MNTEFAPYTEALELKQLGFDEPCFAYFGEINGGEIELFFKRNFDTEARYVLAPLYQQAFRWFREHQEWPIESWIRPFISQQPRSYSAMIWTRGQIIHAGVFSTHNEAQLGLLRKLIEIVKTKQ